MLAEGLLLLWLVHNWGRLNHKVVNLFTLSALFVITWIIDNFFLHTIHTINSIYRVVYAFVLVFLFVDQINYIIVHERGNILKEASFIISVSFVFYFSYKAFIEVFYMFHISMSDDFYANIFNIMKVANIITNCTLGIAILWISKKQKFTLPY